MKHTVDISKEKMSIEVIKTGYDAYVTKYNKIPKKLKVSKNQYHYLLLNLANKSTYPVQLPHTLPLLLNMKVVY